MKFWILRILGVLSILFGLAFLAIAVGEFRSGEPQNPFLGLVLSLMFVAIGLFIFRAVRIKYRFNLSILIGACLVFFGLSMVAMEVESLIAGNTEGLIFVLIAATIFLVSGVLLVRSGHQQHLKTMTA
jgi:heme/copper-type cytochrome/quinol oxidase subunit 4